jgi:hypothetical protein
MRGLSNPPTSPVAASLLSPEKPPPALGARVVEVRMLKDARGQTSHTGRPYVFEAREGESYSVSGDLAKLWLKSGTCVLAENEPPAEATSPAEPSLAAKPKARKRRRKR